MKHSIGRLVFGVSFLAFASPAFATLQEAMEAVADGDYSFAIEELTRLAEKEKNAEARYSLGALYEKGAGVPQDEMKALEIYQQAADEGSAKGALKIGNAFYTGQGRDKDYAKAFQWYKKAAEKGNYPAQYNIGLMLEEGVGVKKDTVEAFGYYKKSADQGYAPAQIALGRMFLKGIGTPQDFSQAVFWYKLAADQGNIKAQMELAKLYSNTTVRGLPFNVIGAHVYFNLISAYGTSPLKEEAAQKRNELMQNMRNEDVAIAQSRAQKWKKKTREESLPRLAREAASLEEAGLEGGAKNDASQKEEEKEEIKVTAKTAVQEVIVAGGVSRRDLNRAVRDDNFQPVVDTLKKNADAGNAVAKLALADVYVLGQGIKADPKQAVAIYSELGKNNDPIAFYRLAPMYCEGNGVEPDLIECYKYMLLAKKYADEDSLPTIAEALQMLDENLDKEIRDAGKKQAGVWGEKAEPTKTEKKKLFGLFGGDSDDGDAMDKPEEKKEDAKPAKKADKKADDKSKAADDEDDLFADL